MNQNTVINRLLQRAVLAALFGSAAVPSRAGEVNVDIHIDNRPPPPVVVVREREPARVIVVEEREPVVYETYVVGYRRNLYDADLRVRIARSDEWEAHEELAAARRHEGELAVRLDEQEALIEELRHRVGNPGRVAELHARTGETAELAADLRKRLGALDHRVAAAREDFEAAKTLGDRDGMADAADRLKANEARAATTAADLRDAEERMARLEREEAEAKAMAADTERLHDAEDRAADLHHQLNIAHDAVYSTQRRLTAAQDEVYVALHDRDESLWLLHRDEILVGRFEPERCGFVIDLSIWGGRMPRDPEVVHAYCVHDVGYWRSNPVYVEERVVVVERVTEVTRVREIQRVREVDKIQRVERVEKVVKVEDRRHVAEVAVVERKRFEAETVERKTAIAEHRAPKPVYIEKPAVVKPAIATPANATPALATPAGPGAIKAASPKEEVRMPAGKHGANTRADVVTKTQAEETGKGEGASEKVERNAQRPAEKMVEKTSEKPVEKAPDKIAEKRVEKAEVKPVEKTPEKTVERPAEKTPEKPAPEARRRTEDEKRPVAEPKRPVVQSDADSSARSRRRGDPPSDPVPTPPQPQPSAKQRGNAPATDNPRDPKGIRDPRNRDPQQP
jgi:hypothetical protein